MCIRDRIYEVLKRRNLEKKINSAKIIFFEKDKNIGSGNRVQFLEDFIKSNTPEILSNKPHSTAIALTYRASRLSDNAESIFSEPVPVLSIVKCEDDDSWSKALWKMNQSSSANKEQFTVLIRNQDDIKRLKYAILTKKCIELNSENFALKLSNFSRGRLLLMPRVTTKDIELIDIDVAQAFFYSEMYYQAQQVAMEKDIAAFQRITKEKQHLQILNLPRRN